MSTPKILVLGGTGPAGICLLRELLHRNHTVVAYVRNPSKVPADLSSNPLLSVVKGEMGDVEAFSTALSGCSTILSLLGPKISDKEIPPTMYPDMYRNTVIPGMRKNGVKRIFLMGTIAIERPEDSWTLIKTVVTTFMKLLVKNLYLYMQNLAALWDETQDLDWTVFRISVIPGEPDEESWRKGREEGKIYVGPLGAKGWGMNTNRSLLARWLVDSAESGANEWVRKMPAVARLAGS